MSWVEISFLLGTLVGAGCFAWLWVRAVRNCEAAEREKEMAKVLASRAIYKGRAQAAATDYWRDRALAAEQSTADGGEEPAFEMRHMGGYWPGPDNPKGRGR